MSEKNFEWTDYKRKPIETEVIKKEPVSSTEASDEFFRKIAKTSADVLGVTASAETLWIIGDVLSKKDSVLQDPVLLIAGTISGITAGASFVLASKLKKR